MVQLAALASAPPAWASLEAPLFTVGEQSLDERQRQLEELQEHSGGDPYVLEELGRIAYRRSNVPLARQLWDQAAEQDPNIPRAEVQLVFADISLGRLDAAQQRLEALDVGSMSDAHVLIAAGELALVRNDPKTANDFLIRALDMAPELPATHLTLGHFLEATHDDESAQASYEKVTELQPDRATGWLRLAALHFRMGRHDDALAAYRQAEACRGLQPVAETRMGEAYLLSNNLPAAIQHFGVAVKRDQEDPFPRLRIAQILRRVGRIDEARAQLEEILESTEYLAALKLMAEIELEANQLEKAIGFYRRALKAEPNDWQVANNLAILLVQTGGSGAEAVDFAVQARRAAGEQASVLQGAWGCALWLAERYDEAAPALEKAIAATPNYPWTRYCYGKVLLELDRPVEAREQFQTCQFLAPEFPRRDEVNRLLATPDAAK
jgi:tetratricopeptide (TPR) repeat protein